MQARRAWIDPGEPPLRWNSEGAGLEYVDQRLAARHVPLGEGPTGAAAGLHDQAAIEGKVADEGQIERCGAACAAATPALVEEMHSGPRIEQRTAD